MIRIALVIGQLGLGGAEKQLCQLATGLPKWNYRPIVISLTPGGQRENVLRAKGVETHALTRKRSFDLRRLRQIVEILRDFKPEIVHGFDSTGGVYGRLAGLLAGVPTLIGGIRYEGMQPSRVLFIEKLMRWKTDAVITNSLAGKMAWARFTGYPKQKIVLIPNGFDFEEMKHPPGGFRPLRQLLSLPKDEPVIGCIGSICERKNPMMLIEIAASLSLSGTRAHYVWIGDGPMRDQVERAIDRHNLRGFFHLLGARPDAQWLAKDFDIAVLTSIFEGLPNVILEYMFWGIPVVTTNAGDCSTVVKHEHSGFIVEKNDIPAMVACIKRLLEDRSTASVMGSRGRATLEKEFSAEVMLARTVAVYEAIRKRKQMSSSHGVTVRLEQLDDYFLRTRRNP